MRYVMILLLATMAFGGESFSITEKWWYGFTWPEYKTYNEIRTIRQNVKHIANTMDNNDDDEGWHKSYLSEETEYYDQMREYYEDKYGTDKAVALALIKTSERYKTNILNVGRMVYMETCPAEPLTDGEIDVKTMSMVKQIGFTKKGAGWTYDGYGVKMGSSRPIPASVKKYPRESKVIEISFSPKIKPSKERIASFSIKTNLPEGFTVLVSLKNERNDTLEFRQDIEVSNGLLEFSFGSKESPLPKGIYSLSFRGYLVGQTKEWLDSPERSKIGDHFENLCGRFAYENWGLSKDVQAKKLIIFEVK